MRTLCSGATRANTPTPSIRSTSAASSRSSSSPPVRTAPGMPRSAAIAWAVAAWSPVIIFTATPALAQWAMATLASGREGSSSPTRPTSVNPPSGSRGCGVPVRAWSQGPRSAEASASTLKPAVAMVSVAVVHISSTASSSGTVATPRRACVARACSASHDPLTRTTRRPSRSW